MKLLLSWLREYVALPDPVDLDALSDTLAMLGLPVEETVRVGGVPGVVTARVERTEQHPDARNTQRVWVDTGDGPRAPRLVRRVQLPARRRRAAGDARHRDARRAHDRQARHPRHRLRGDAVLGARARARRRPQRHPRAAARRATRRAVRRRHRPARRRRHRRRRHPQPARLLVVRRRRPRSGGQARRGLHAAGATAGRRPSTDRARRSRSSTATAAAASRRPCSPASPSARRHRGWPSAWPPPACARSTTSSTSATTSCSSSASRTTPTTWRRSGRPGFRIRVARDGEQLVTLDDVTRRLAPTDLLICDATDVPIGIAGIMGGADTEISERTTAVALEVAWFEPVGIGLSVARLGLRSEASARNERGVDPWQIDTSIARFVELLAETCPELAVADGAVDARAPSLPPRDRSCTRAHQRGQPDHRHLAHRRRPAAPARPDRVHGQRRTATSAPSPCRRGAATAPTRSTSSRRSPGSTATTGSAWCCPAVTQHGRLSVHQQRRRLLREVLLGLGVTEVMPNAFLAPDTLTRAGLDGDALRITNPLVAEESVLRTSLRPGLLRAVAFNESHRRSGVALFEIGHVYPPGPGELPAEYEALGVVLAGAGGARRRRPVAGDRRRPRRRRPHRPGSGAARPARHPLGDARRRARRHRRRRRGRAGRARGVRRSASGSPCSSSTSMPSSVRNRSRWRGSRPAASRRATSTWRSPSPTTSRPRSSTRRSARAPGRCSSTSASSTSTAARASATVDAAWPTASACRPPTAT